MYVDPTPGGARPRAILIPVPSNNTVLNIMLLLLLLCLVLLVSLVLLVLLVLPDPRCSWGGLTIVSAAYES